MGEIAQDVKRSICAAPELRAEIKKAVETLNKIDVSPRSKKMAENKIEKQISLAFNFHGNEVQFLGMKLPELFREVRLAVAQGADLDDEMQKAVRKHRIN